MPKQNKEWLCTKCGLPFFYSEATILNNLEYCYSCFEDMVDGAEERRIKRIMREQERERED